MPGFAPTAAKRTRQTRQRGRNPRANDSTATERVQRRVRIRAAAAAAVPQDLRGANDERQRQPSCPPRSGRRKSGGESSARSVSQATRPAYPPGRSQVFEDQESPVSEPSHKGSSPLPRSRSPNGGDLSVPFQKERRNRRQRSGQEELRAALGEERPPRGTNPGPSSATGGGGRKSPPPTLPASAPREPLLNHIHTHTPQERQPLTLGLWSHLRTAAGSMAGAGSRAARELALARRALRNTPELLGALGLKLAPPTGGSKASVTRAGIL